MITLMESGGSSRVDPSKVSNSSEKNEYKKNSTTSENSGDDIQRAVSFSVEENVSIVKELELADADGSSSVDADLDTVAPFRRDAEGQAMQVM